MSSPLRFSPEEAMPARSLKGLPAVLHIGSTPVNFKVSLIRLLTGTLNVRCNFKNIVIKQRINYSQLPYNHNKQISGLTLRRAIQPYKIKDLSTYVIKTRSANYKFYKELFVEFSNYFLRKNEHNEVTAFLHLYRILESIAYCFPLVWASRAKDYEGTFIKLKDYFNGPKTGELGVFKRFIDDIINPSILNTQVQISINSIHPDWQKSYYQSIYKNIISTDIVSYTEFSDITVKCHCLTDLLISLRNQYFHFLTGQSHNLGSEDVVESNEFFGIINEIMANWLAVIFFEILDYEMSS